MGFANDVTAWRAGRLVCRWPGEACWCGTAEAGGRPIACYDWGNETRSSPGEMKHEVQAAWAQKLLGAPKLCLCNGEGRVTGIQTLDMSTGRARRGESGRED